MNVKQLIDSELSKKTFAEIDIYKLLKCYLISERKSDFQYKNEFTDYLLSLNSKFNIKFSNFEREKKIKLENEFGDVLSITRHMVSMHITAEEQETINIRVRKKNPFNLILPITEFSSNDIKLCEYDKDISVNRDFNKKEIIKNIYSMIVYEDIKEKNLASGSGTRTFSFRQMNNKNPEIFSSEKQEIFKEIVNRIKSKENLDEDFFDFFKLTNDLYDESIKRIFLNDFKNNYFQNSHISLLADINKIYKDKITQKTKNT